MKIGKILKKRRRSKNLTQSQVAEQSGVSRVHYTHIENGVRRPSPDVAQKIAKLLDFDWTIFFTQSSNEKKQKAI